MKRTAISLTAMLLLAATGCSSNDSSSPPGGPGDSAKTGTGDYMLMLTGYQPHANQMVQLHVKNAQGATVGSANGMIGADGTLMLTVPNVLHDGGSYKADFFVDNFPAGAPNGIYDAPTNPNDVKGSIRDHSWRLDIAGSAAGVSKTYQHDANWTDLSPF